MQICIQYADFLFLSSLKRNADAELFSSVLTDLANYLRLEHNPVLKPTNHMTEGFDEGNESILEYLIAFTFFRGSSICKIFIFERNLYFK